MSYPDYMETTGICRNEESQCYEAWLVRPETGERILIASCSMDVPPESLRWWEQRVWGEWLPEWGIQRLCTQAA